MEEFLVKNSKLLVFSLVGLILVGFGVLSYKTDMFVSGDKVEVLSSNTEGNADPDIHDNIIVEITGAVEKPGVYSFKEGSRIDDLLISAGGISGDADRAWVDKYINRASKLTDGQKVYIYHSNETSARDNSSIKLDQSVLGVSEQNFGGLTNINTASQLKLEELTGIGPVFAQKIIEHRPYSNIEELVTKGVVNKKTYEKFKNEIVVY